MLQLGLRRIFARNVALQPLSHRVVFYYREKRHSRKKPGSVSKRLAHFERVLDGNRRILRKKTQPTSVVTN